MPELRTIEIDFALHKKIEAERRSLSEPEYEVLKRLIGIDAGTPEAAAVTGRAWGGKGVTLPHGTQLQMEYNGRQYTGVIDDGLWHIDGKTFKSPSAAAGGVALTKDGRKTSLDGWIYWYVKRPGDARWTLIRDLRSH